MRLEGKQCFYFQILTWKSSKYVFLESRRECFTDTKMNNFAYAFHMHSACIPHPHFSCILSAFCLHSRKSVFFVFQALETKNFRFQGFYFFANFRKQKKQGFHFFCKLQRAKKTRISFFTNFESEKTRNLFFFSL